MIELGFALKEKKRLCYDESRVCINFVVDALLEFVFEFEVIVLNDCHYCLTFMMNVISVGLLTKSGYTLLIKKNYYDIILNDIIKFHGQLKHDIYTLPWPINVIYMTNKCPKIDKVSEIYLWHCWLGHINKNRINKITQ